ncbi:AraC family transcriptional regulator [Fulvivirga kasyanovii]|uniref:AraC family transcriptional regulator n=1 Tax=Fulvivirga kasyanovii TaxID=396812 RepID=A0ABW9RLW8_9BACT|nr:AraC family transcriptional regulator [Fulvivirga kasyanovii]MTI24185.1 AraC family transcriptional regulator [Fulvivirga kasyanovii]
MKKQLYQPFELHVSDLAYWKQHALVYHFFEIMRIDQGEGSREVNENIYDYSEGDIFLFTPLDCRGFRSDKETRVCSIRFSQVFLTQYKTAGERERVTRWLKQLEQIFYHHNRFQPLIIKGVADRTAITSLIDNLTGEYNRKEAYYEDNLRHLITLILNILMRSVVHERRGEGCDFKEEPLINKVLLHIRQNIHDKKKIKTAYLAERFNLSKTYVGEYFKKITGESLQSYITLYKMKLVEQRLASSTLSISEIAHELDFSDGSHLSSQFKKYIGVSPTVYRSKHVKAGQE